MTGDAGAGAEPDSAPVPTEQANAEDAPPATADPHLTGLEDGLITSGTARLVLDDGTTVSYLQYEWDADARVIDLGNARTAEGHRERGYATRLLAALVDAAPPGAVLRAVGLHSEEGLDWMAGALKRGYRIHLSFWCFKGEERCVGRAHPDPCPVESDERVAWAAP